MRIYTRPNDHDILTIDFQASWFRKYVAPRYLVEEEEDVLEIELDRDTFLGCFAFSSETREIELIIDIK